MKFPSQPFALALSASLILCLGSCESSRHHHAGDHDGAHGGASASAEIVGRSGSNLHGNVTFEEMEGGTLIHLKVEDAPPGFHAVHIHDVGDCSSPDGKSAGGHFNPDGHAHGAPSAEMRHAGDLGNMWVDENGEGHLVMLSRDLTVSPGTHSVMGRGIIVHEKADDLVSQPTGAAGGRIGCGEIR